MNTNRLGQYAAEWRRGVVWAWIFTLGIAGGGPPIASAGMPILQPQKLMELPWGKGRAELGIRAARTTSGQIQYDVPSDFDADRSGNFYIADPVNRRIVVLTPTGQGQAVIPIRDRPRLTFLAVQPDGERIVTSQASGPFALCAYRRDGGRIGCNRLPPGYVYRTLKRSIGISTKGNIYALGFHRTGEQHDSLFVFHGIQSEPQVILSTKRSARTFEGPFLRDFCVSDERVLTAIARADRTNVGHGSYTLIRPHQQAVEYTVQETATGRLVGFVGNQVGAFPGGFNMEGPAEFHQTTLAPNGVATTVKYAIPYPSTDIYSDLDGTKLVFRLVAPSRLSALAATKRGVLLVEYSLPNNP
jgi:hypothetical protein